MSARLPARLLALGLGLALLPDLAGPPARAAGMPAYGTKNFMPGPATPSYFTGEGGIPYAGPQEFPARHAGQGEIGPRYPMAAAAPARRDLYARPAWPAKGAAMRRRWTRPAHALSRYERNRAERARLLRLARLRALRLARLRLRRRTAWRR
jgi:hypothetical protein